MPPVLYRTYRYNPTRPTTPPPRASIVPPSPPMSRPITTAAAPTPIIATLEPAPMRASYGRAGSGTFAATGRVIPAGAMRGPGADAGWTATTGAGVAMVDT